MPTLATVGKPVYALYPPQLEDAPPTFLTLPREIRNQIYKLLLVSPSPIIVWSAKLEEKWGIDYSTSKPFRFHRFAHDRTAIAASLKDLTPSLMRCNRTIDLEASTFFYGSNTFAFEGDHDWLPIISWFDRIGLVNRSLLRHLTATVQQPSGAWQRADSSRVRLHSRSRECFPRNPSLAHPAGAAVPEGEVENVNPALETIFSILGRRTDDLDEFPVPVPSEQLVFTFAVAFNLIPGVVVPAQRPRGLEGERPHCAGRYMGLDMANLVEKWRGEYADSLDVLWQVETETVRIDEKKALMRERGWDIVREERAETLEAWGMVEGWTLPLSSQQADWDEPKPSVKFTLRRREVRGPVMASEPNPYSSWGGPSTI